MLIDVINKAIYLDVWMYFIWYDYVSYETCYKSLLNYFLNKKQIKKIIVGNKINFIYNKYINYKKFYGY